MEGATARAGDEVPEITKLFEKLNNPIAVVLILAAMLAVNGFLFYQQRSTPPEEANAPDETPAQPSEPSESDEPNGADNEPSETGSQGKGEPQNGTDDEPSETGSQGEGKSQNGQSDQPSDEQAPDDEPSEETPSEETPDEEPSEEEPAEEARSREAPSGDGPRNNSGGESQDGQGGQNGQASGGGSGADGARGAPLAGLGDTLDGCEGDQEGCVRDFVSEVSPESSYIGGRTDLASGDSGQNTEVLYFEDPGLEACQFERGRHETPDSLDYTVILVGPGSFNDERGEECIPTT